MSSAFCLMTKKNQKERVKTSHENGNESSFRCDEKKVLGRDDVVVVRQRICLH